MPRLPAMEVLGFLTMQLALCTSTARIVWAFILAE